MLHHSLATRPNHPSASRSPRPSASLQARRSAPTTQEDLPQLVRRLVQSGWDYDRIRQRVARQFPLAAPTAAARCQQREWIARLIARYRHGEPVRSVSP
jgi:hypothetical protein